MAIICHVLTAIMAILSILAIMAIMILHVMVLDMVDIDVYVKNWKNVDKQWKRNWKIARLKTVTKGKNFLFRI